MYNLFVGDPTLVLAKEQAFLKAKEEFQNMIELAKQAASNGVLVHHLEVDLWAGLLKMGRHMLQGYVDSQGTGDIGPTLEHEGQVLNRLDVLFDRRYVSIFGPLRICRTVYGTRLTQKFEVIPLDARLGLPESDFSYVLQRWDQITPWNISGRLRIAFFQKAAMRQKHL